MTCINRFQGQKCGKWQKTWKSSQTTFTVHDHTLRSEKNNKI